MRGARWVQSNVLETHPDADVRVYAVFFEMVRGDRGAKNTVDPAEMLDDPRVRVFWDEQKLVGRWFDQNVTRLGERNGEPDRVEWDSYFLYGPDAEWEAESPPSISSWGRPLIRENERLLRGLEALWAREER